MQIVAVELYSGETKRFKDAKIKRVGSKFVIQTPAGKTRVELNAVDVFDWSYENDNCTATD